MFNPVALAANIRVGFDALRIHPLRTLLSVLGITIGCASLIATMAVSDGLLGFARDTIRKQTSVQVIEIGPRRAVFEEGRWVAVHDYPIFTSEDAQALHAWVGRGSTTTMTLAGQATARYRGVRHIVHIALGTAALPDFGGVDIAATPFEDRENPSFSVIAPIGAARALLDPPANGRFAPAIRLMAPSLESVDHVQGSIVDWVSRRYPRWEERVNVTVRLEQLAEVEKAIHLTKLFIGALVGISLVVGGVGIMNVLLASVAERTREIGIRKSVGARSADIRRQFLTEAVAIALVGAVAGLVIGFLVAAAVTLGFRQLAGAAIYPVLSLESVLVATLASSLVGLLFGTYPARRAASLPPVVAIAQE